MECGIGWVRVKWGGVRSVKLVGARERNGSGRLGIPDLGNREKSYFYPKERISSKSKIPVSRCYTWFRLFLIFFPNIFNFLFTFPYKESVFRDSQV